jgi:hypothetical protein
VNRSMARTQWRVVAGRAPFQGSDRLSPARLSLALATGESRGWRALMVLMVPASSRVAVRWDTGSV